MSSCCHGLNELGHYALMGDFTKFTVPQNSLIIDQLFLNQAPKCLDLENIEGFDSALVALLISYKNNFPDIELVNVPLQLDKLLVLYNVRTWF